MVDWIDEKRGGPIVPPRLLPPLPGPDYQGKAGGWLTGPPPEPPWLIGVWSASCWYCRRALQLLVPLAAEVGLPFVALHAPEFPDDEEPEFPEQVLRELGLPIGRPGVHHLRDGRAWAELVAIHSWPTHLVVDRDRRATFLLIGYAGEQDPMLPPLRAALEATRRDG